MAETTVVYYHRNRDNWEENALCFICATKKAITADPEKEEIYIRSANKYTSCSECGYSIMDIIEI